MNILQIIFPVLIGSLIGYCTNYLAIRMLFHPYKAVYIGKWKLPLTPGIIPKNQSRVASSLGNAVAEQLLTKETIAENFRKGNTGKNLISEMVSSVCENDRPVSEWLPDSEHGEEMIDVVSTILSRSIMKKIQSVDLRPVIEGIGEEALESLISSRPLLSMFLNDGLKTSIYDRLEIVLSNYLENHGEEALKQFSSEYLRESGERSVYEIIQSGADPERVKIILSDMIEQLAVRYGNELLDQIDVGEITRQKIEEMKVDEVEHLVLSIMKQELQVVINLGALIGAVIGTVNIFI